MGLRDEKEEVLDEGRRGTRLGGEGGKLEGNGMRDVWVIGEGFFRGVGGVFDVNYPLSRISVVMMLTFVLVQTAPCRLPCILRVTEYVGVARDVGCNMQSPSIKVSP